MSHQYFVLPNRCFVLSHQYFVLTHQSFVLPKPIFCLALQIFCLVPRICLACHTNFIRLVTPIFCLTPPIFLYCPTNILSCPSNRFGLHHQYSDGWRRIYGFRCLWHWDYQVNGWPTQNKSKFDAHWSIYWLTNLASELTLDLRSGACAAAYFRLS